MARLRPELLLRPLLPTQLLQTGFAFLSQAALFAYVSSFPSACTSSVMSGAPLEAGGVDSSAAAPSLKVGTVSVLCCSALCLAAYLTSLPPP